MENNAELYNKDSVTVLADVQLFQILDFEWYFYIIHKLCPQKNCACVSLWITP